MKTCVVGLDGATWELLDPWLDDLPTIRRFSESVRGELDSCIPPISIPAWKCYSTGMDPGSLGVFTFVEPNFDTHRLETVSNQTFTHREIWDYLSDGGYKSACLNMPSTSPPRDIDGWMVSGPFSDPDDFARPASFQSELREAGYTILPDYYLSRSEDAIPDALAAVEEKFETALGLKTKADFVHLTIYTTDTVQHAEWDSDVCREFWVGVDRLLGEFVEELGAPWNVVLMSDHGFGPSKGHFYLNTWLVENGYMELGGGRVDFGDVAGFLGLDYETIYSLVHRLHLTGLLRTIFPSEFLLRVARQMPGNRKLEGTQGKIDWDADAVALAPLIYTRNSAVADEIRRGLLAVTDRNGDRVIDDVYYGDELYPDCAVRVPDLVVKHSEYVISDIVNPDAVIDYDFEGKLIAHHRRNGIVAAMGPDVRDADLSDARLYDLAPTILDGFGVRIPATMRGNSLGLLGTHGDTAEVSTDSREERVVEHDDAVEQKLKDLGYL